MPQLPSVKPKQLIQALKKLGFYESRQRGTSHLVMVHPDGRRAVIALRSGGELCKGFLVMGFEPYLSTLSLRCKNFWASEYLIRD